MSRLHAITIAVGQKGVGKTTLTKKVLANYAQESEGKKARPVLIFDTNHEEAYKEYDSIFFNVEEPDDFKRGEPIRKLVEANELRKRHKNLFREAFIRKIIPILPNGKPMTRTQKGTAAITILDNFKNGLVVLEDINSFQQDFHKGDIVDKILTNRHNGLDIMLHFQSLKRVSPILLENTLFFRLQKQMDSVSSYPENRFASYPLMRIAEIIIEKNYEHDPRYFLYVDAQNGKIIMEKNAKMQAEAVEQFVAEHPKFIRQTKDFLKFF